MWILDEQTIITCFPKRYGANKAGDRRIQRAQKYPDEVTELAPEPYSLSIRPRARNY